MTAAQRCEDFTRNGEGDQCRRSATFTVTPDAGESWGVCWQHVGVHRYLLGRVVWDTARWGDYAPAIARWEAVMGRPAPDPTDEKGRLSPALVTWMMGFPEDWLLGTRTQRLRQLGNAVVP